ncbi:MAG: hypothetical protein QOG34_1078 [Frankiaceae bacterium]|jgi:hypothetical protein|nr:hypothetical protein [Frankiaceae bacterium]
MRGAARLATAVALVVAPLLPGVSAAESPAQTHAQAAAKSIPLPQTFRNINPVRCLQLPFRKDRCRTSKVPGTVDDTELLNVGVGPTGDPAIVTDRQHLVVHGAGAYLIYELGPTRKVDGLNEFSQPQAQLGQVVWQGFSTGTRALDGLLVLDPVIEANRLPLAIRIQFVDRHRKPHSLQPGGRAPVDGTATITLLNISSSPRFLGVGNAALPPLIRALDTLYAAAKSEPRGLPPYAGNGLPASVPGTLIGQTESTVTAPLHVDGRLTVSGSTGTPVTGLGSHPIAGGATLSGFLNTMPATFHAQLDAGQRLALSLDVQPWLDQRTCAPPDHGPSWAAWAATHPDAAAIGDATATLIGTAAQAARAADYSPYLQTDTNGQAASSFHYEMASEAATRRAGKTLTAKPGAIVAACLAGLAIAGNAALLRRQW